MAKPQQPELHRSGTGATDPASTKTSVEVQPGLPTEGEVGPIPEDNLPGHHPAREQDKPDLDAFRARFSGADRPDGDGDRTSGAAEQRPDEDDGDSTAAPRPSGAGAARTTADVGQPGGLAGMFGRAPRPVQAAAALAVLPWLPLVIGWAVWREVQRRIYERR